MSTVDEEGEVESVPLPAPPDDTEEVLELRRRIKEIAVDLKAKASTITTLEVTLHAQRLQGFVRDVLLLVCVGENGRGVLRGRPHRTSPKGSVWRLLP
jgi:hypothetical protein